MPYMAYIEKIKSEVNAISVDDGNFRTNNFQIIIKFNIRQFIRDIKFISGNLLSVE